MRTYTRASKKSMRVKTISDVTLSDYDWRERSAKPSNLSRTLSAVFRN